MATTTSHHHLPTRTLTPPYPCHPERGVRLVALEEVPREVYWRTCPACGTSWRVARTTLVERPGVAVDRLDWEEAGA